MHDEAHQYVVGGKLNNECSTLLFSPFSSFVSKIANTRLFHRERSNHENTYTLLYFAGILFKSETTERKVKFSIYFSGCEISIML